MFRQVNNLVASINLTNSSHLFSTVNYTFSHHSFFILLETLEAKVIFESQQQRKPLFPVNVQFEILYQISKLKFHEFYIVLHSFK